jgi:hypothetical protein
MGNADRRKRSQRLAMELHAASFIAPVNQPPPADHVYAVKVGQAGRPNPVFEHLRTHGVTPTGLAVIGERVPDDVYARWMELCRGCRHSSVMSDGGVHCECVPCSRWRTDMRKQNRFSTSTCRKCPPAFVPLNIPEEHRWRWFGTGGTV